MEKIRLITDAASDISVEYEKELDIRVLPFQVVIGEKSYTSRVDFDNEGFFKLMEQFDDIPKTSQITPYEFQKVYEEEAKAGYTDIFVVLINANGSSTYGNSVMAKDAFFDAHPEYEGKVRIYNFDSKGYSAMYGMPLMEAARMRDEGKSAGSIAAYMENALKHRRIYFGMFSLFYAGKSGRIPTAAAFVGDKLKLKPVMKICNGAITTGAKVRGEGKLIGKVVDMCLADIEPGSPYEIIYGNDIEAMEEFRDQLKERLGYEPSGYYQIGVAIAVNCGPKAVGVSFNTKKE